MRHLLRLNISIRQSTARVNGYAVSAECLAATRKENVSRNGVLDPWDQVPFVIGACCLRGAKLPGISC